MEVSVNVKLTKKELFDYMMRHNYSSFGGIVGALLGIGALILFICNVGNKDMNIEYKLALLFVFGLSFIAQPVLLYMKAVTQAKKSEAINKPLEYRFDEKGIKISVEENSVEHEYEAVTKVISTKLSVIIYVSRYNAFIIPKVSLGNQFDDFKKLIEENVKCMKVSVK